MVDRPRVSCLALVKFGSWRKGEEQREGREGKGGKGEEKGRERVKGE